ncbi:hypothetical protein AWENTII_005974 [Aspergillus wentii]|nr:hypothetical protein MW887_000143 [Aspergillus wentii]
MVLQSSSALGVFAKLPPEIRLNIWEHLWDDLFPFGVRNFKLPKLYIGRTTLAILRASRQLYEEISHHLYANLTLEIHISPRYFAKDWALFICKNPHAVWRIESEKEAVWYGFLDFPYYKAKIEIVLHAPSPDDPAQVHLVWHRAHKIVDFLNQMPVLRAVTIRLHPFGVENDWCRNGRANRSIPYMDLRDYDIAFLPFTRLRNVEKIEAVTHSRELDEAINWRIIKHGREYILRRHWILPDIPKYEKVARAFSYLDLYLAQVHYRLYRDLPRLRGKTKRKLLQRLCWKRIQRNGKGELQEAREKIWYLESKRENGRLLQEKIYAWLWCIPDPRADWRLHLGQTGCLDWA